MSQIAWPWRRHTMCLAQVRNLVLDSLLGVNILGNDYKTRKYLKELSRESKEHWP